MLGQMNQTLGNSTAKLRQSLQHGAKVINHGKEIYNQARTIYSAGRRIGSEVKEAKKYMKHHMGNGPKRALESLQSSGGSAPPPAHSANKRSRKKY